MEAAISQAITPSATSSKILVMGAIELNLYATVRVDADIDLVRVVGGTKSTVLEDNYLYNFTW